MEIWIVGTEWFPILVSIGGPQRYLVSWGGIIYKAEEEEKAYQHTQRILVSIMESRRVANIPPSLTANHPPMTCIG